MQCLVLCFIGKYLQSTLNRGDRHSTGGMCTDLLQHFQESSHRSLWFCFEDKSLVVGEKEVVFSTGVGDISGDCKLVARL